ncbi:MAG TPA: hypothetical protein VM286_07790 [Candidatus Thermoplasmatota archaeon]|nr:hypothetical protein [Candidatus Thermoplasmatota archaeon]
MNPAQSTPTTLYFHVASAGQDFPINTQAPPATFERDDQLGVAAATLTCLPEGMPLEAQRRAFTTYHGFSSSGPVEYNATPGHEDRAPRIHPERGLLHDAVLDAEQAPAIHWFLTTGANPQGGPVPLPLANVVARATVRAGEWITPGHEGYETGAVIAQGQTAPATLAGPATFSGMPGGAHPQVTVEDRGREGYLYGFTIPLAYASTTIPRHEGFSVRIDLFMDVPACDIEDGHAVMPNLVRVHTDATHRPRLDLAAMDPLRIAYVHPQFLGPDLVVHASVESPWGTYDVDDPGLQLTIEGPEGPVQGIFRTPPVQRYHEHNGHLRALDATYIWPFPPGGAQEGTYVIRFVAQNGQHTATATGTVQFDVGKHLKVTKCGLTGVEEAAADGTTPPCIEEYQDGNGKVLDPASFASPGLQVLGVLGALAMAAARARRRG